MRSDMFKIIVERPRHGGDIATKGRVFQKGKQDPDRLPKQEGILPKNTGSRYSFDRKTLNENLSPLRRFLRSRIGKRWDDVYSEICEHIDSNSTVKKHVLDHVKDYVEQDIVMINGIPHAKPLFRRGYFPITDYGGRGFSFYVDYHGILRLAPRDTRQTHKEKKPRGVKIKDGRIAIRDKGIWWLVSLKYLDGLTTRLELRYFVTDVILGPLWELTSVRYKIKETYGSEDMYGFEKKQMSKKEIKKLFKGEL